VEHVVRDGGFVPIRRHESSVASGRARHLQNLIDLGHFWLMGGITGRVSTQEFCSLVITGKLAVPAKVGMS